MFFKKILKRIDNKICMYLGLEREEISAKSIHWAVDKLVVVHTSSYKRHIISLPWHDFARLDIKNVDNKNLEKLGRAAGAATAKRLVVTFQEANVNK